MESEGASGLWLFAVLGGPAILAVALIYGTWQWRRRLDALREDATRANYKAEKGDRSDAPESDFDDETRI
jgi:hypothetical protein